MGYKQLYLFPLLLILVSSTVANPTNVTPENITSFNIKFSTLFGGTSTMISESGQGIALDGNGDIVIVGQTQSSDFPLKNAYNSTFMGYSAGFVSKFSSQGELLWSTYLGSGFLDTLPLDVAVDIMNNNEVIVVGETQDPTFPTTSGAISETHHGMRDVFVTKFTKDGDLLWSTFIGGTSGESVGQFNLTQGGDILITGLTGSSDFPTLNAINSTLNGVVDAYITKISPSGNLIFSTFFGGSEGEEGTAIVVNELEEIYLFGSTFSSDFPVLIPDNTIYSENGRLFLSKFNSSGQLIWSNRFGGSSTDFAGYLGIDDNGHVYVSGETSSSDFPTTIDAFNTTYGGAGDIYFLKFTPDGVLEWSTYLGGSSGDLFSALSISNDTIVITGSTFSTDFPLLNPYDSTLDKTQDIFVSSFTLDGSLTSSTFFGSSQDGERVYDLVVRDHLIYLTGFTADNCFPTTNGNPYPEGDVFITVFSDNQITPEPVISYLNCITTSSGQSHSSSTLFSTTQPNSEGELIISVSLIPVLSTLTIFIFFSRRCKSF